MTQAHSAASARLPVRPDPRKIVVPRKHAQVLIEPPLPVLKTAFAVQPPIDADLFGRPLQELRADARRHLLEQAAKWAELVGAPVPGMPNGPLVLTGHQV